MECLQKGGMGVLDWLVRLINVSFDDGAVPMDYGVLVQCSRTKGMVTNVNVATREVLVC